MQRPGQTLAAISARFSPALQPAHIRDLVDLLHRLRCVSVAKVVRAGLARLFGPPADLRLEAPDLLDDDADLVAEAEVDAIVKLGQFIGDKQYAVDFVCQCSCHPDRRL